MNIKNIWTESEKINIGTMQDWKVIPVKKDEIIEVPDEFKTTQEFKNLKRCGYIEVVKVKKEKVTKDE